MTQSKATRTIIDTHRHIFGPKLRQKFVENIGFDDSKPLPQANAGEMFFYRESVDVDYSMEIQRQSGVTSCVNSYGGEVETFAQQIIKANTIDTLKFLNDESFELRDRFPDEVACKRYCPVVVGPNGRIKPDWVMVNDRQERHPEGAYYLDWNEDGKRRRMSVGTDAAAAYKSRARKQKELDAIAVGLIVSNPIEDDSRLQIRSAIDDFLEEVQLTRQKKTWRGYRVSLGYFQESYDKCFLEEIERKDLLRFAAFLRDTKKLSPRTVHNTFADVLTFLQSQGMPKLIGKNDHPRFVELEVDIYEDDELSEFHAICLPYHSTLYDFFLMSGFREQEAMHVVWSNGRFNSKRHRDALEASIQLDSEGLQGA